MASTPAQLARLAACFTSEPRNQQLAFIIYLLNSSNMTPAQLATQSACFASLSMNQQLAFIIYLLSIGGAGGGGGSANYIANYGGISPTPVPTSGNPFAVDSSTGALWVWNGTTWVQLIA